MSRSKLSISVLPAMLTRSFQTAVLFSSVLLTGVATSQCQITAVAGGNMPDASGDVVASCMWDPDGSGPQSPVVVLGGQFGTLGNALSYGLAAYDPVTRDCSDIGGFSGAVTAMLVAANNDLVVVGHGIFVGGSWVYGVSRFDGTSWQALGSGLGYRPESVVEMPNGDIVAGGFANGNQPVMRWDGVSWSAIGSGITGRVLAMAVMPNGDLIAGGNALQAGGVSLMRWDGSTWSVFAGNISIASSFGASVRVLKVLPNGDLLAAGLMQEAGGVTANGIARWDGTTWSSYGTGTLSAIYSVVVAPNGELFAGGAFATIGAATANKVARWDGAAWHGVGNGVGMPPGPFGNSRAVRTLQQVPGGDLVAGGTFESPNGDADHITRFEGTQWGPLRPGTGAEVLASVELANGDLVIAGEFTSVESVPANFIARRSNGVWLPFGSGADDAIESLFELPNGDLLVGGRFANIGGVAASHIARWDGSAWHAIGAGLPGSVHSIAVDDGGQILAAGLFVDQIAFWDGTAWNGTGLLSTSVGFNRSSLLRTPDGEILATAASFSAGSYLRRWTGFGWQQILTGTYALGPIAVHANGNVAIATTNSVELWDGTSWTSPGSSSFGAFYGGYVHNVTFLPNGDLLVAGSFTSFQQTTMRGLARWDGTAWSEVAGGTVGGVRGLHWRNDGSLALAGGFSSIGSVATAGFAELRTSCPATSVAQGAGCTGSGGLNELAATTLPWLDAGYESQATGMPTNGIAVQVLGLGAVSQAVSAILPQGVAGCTLRVTPDVLSFGLPTAGEFEMELAIPSTTSLIGSSFRQQVLPLDLDASGAILAVTATNALELTIGHF